MPHVAHVCIAEGKITLKSTPYWHTLTCSQGHQISKGRLPVEDTYGRQVREPTLFCSLELKKKKSVVSLP